MADDITLLELVRRAVESLGAKATYKQIYEAVKQDRPSSPKHSVRAHIFLLTVNSRRVEALKRARRGTCHTPSLQWLKDNTGEETWRSLAHNAGPTRSS